MLGFHFQTAQCLTETEQNAALSHYRKVNKRMCIYVTSCSNVFLK